METWLSISLDDFCSIEGVRFQEQQLGSSVAGLKRIAVGL